MKWNFWHQDKEEKELSDYQIDKLLGNKDGDTDAKPKEKSKKETLENY